jgi:hypothetical protein
VSITMQASPSGTSVDVGGPSFVAATDAGTVAPAGRPAIATESISRAARTTARIG